jgi:hypothetical protein
MEEVLYEKVKFTDKKIMDAVKRVQARFGVPDICQELGISTATFYKSICIYATWRISMESQACLQGLYRVVVELEGQTSQTFNS